jgi:leucyl aminopeptidase
VCGKRCCLCLVAQRATDQAHGGVVCIAAGSFRVSIAVQAVAEASYVYTTTKSKAEARALTRCVVGVADVAAARAEFDAGVALVAGIELAREWGNRPANTPPHHAGRCGQGFGQAARVQCKVHGPAEVAKLGMGAFMAVAQG